VSYRVVILPRAQKSLAKIPNPSYESVKKRIVSLGDDPRPPGCQKLKGRDRAWRVRAGDYRIIYEIDDSVLSVTVVDVGHRRDIYR
jgi:mRNA interferase RelE/StbE